MYCTKCGAWIPEGNIFCQKCGNPIRKEAGTNMRPKKKRGSKVAAWILSIAVLCAAAAIIDSYIQGNENNNPSGNAQQQSGEQQVNSFWGNDSSGSSVQYTYADACNIIPNFELKYFLSSLEGADLNTVCTLYQSMSAFEETCDIPQGVKGDRVIELFSLLYVECPELFHVDFSKDIYYTYHSISKEVESVTIPYRLTPSEYTTMVDACEIVINRLINETAGMTDAQKEKHVFDHIASSCWYDMDDRLAMTPYGTLVNYKAKCDGISLAIKWIMESMGIECLCVTGDTIGDPIGHAWNIINIDGRYYVLDLTQSVRQSEYVDMNINDILYSAYNVSDEWLSSNYRIHEHFEKYRTLPICDSMENSYYSTVGAFIREGEDPTLIAEYALSDAVQKGKNAIIQFESNSDLNEFVANLESCLWNWADKENISYTSASYYTFSFNICMISLELE